MKIEKTGYYKVISGFPVKGATSVHKYNKGGRIKVIRVDPIYQKVLIENAPDWTHWNIPVVPIEKEIP